MPDNDPYELARFVTAQQPVYETVVRELQSGYKLSHWMWFVFPQLDGLGQSPASRYYAIQSAAEARAYVRHPVLGPRLLECCSILLTIQSKSASDIFGFPDDMKLQSCMTLFGSLEEPDPVFDRVLGKYYGGQRDQRTLDLLGRRAR
jgi:uncharacterized protein (DUF1810 family)